MICSGQFISPNVVLTAGHCVQDQQTGQYHGNFTFFLQYKGGQYLQAYDWDCAATKTGWVTEGHRWDYAMIRVKEKSVTGYLGWKYGWRNYDSAVIAGYPMDIAGGEAVQEELGPIIVDYENGLVEMRHGDPHFRARLERRRLDWK